MTRPIHPGDTATARKEHLEKELCTCTRCGECRGSGQVEYAIDSYPEWDLDSCNGCSGTGITEVCDRCHELEEFAHDDDI
jgi:DnaJ-class molecular chaperone